MKTTVELPEVLFRKVKALAVSCGMTLKQFSTEALEEHIRCYEVRTDPPWMTGFGALSDLSDENSRILDMIEEESGTIFT